MRTVSLSNALPNQSLTLTEDGDFYELTIRSLKNVMLMDISRNGVVLLTSCRCVDASLILPRYKESGRGNFAFFNDSQNYPWWEDFGTSTRLQYYSPDDLAEARL